MTLTLRTRTATGATTKGARLTSQELDGNFLHVLDSANGTFEQSGSGAVSDTVQNDLRNKGKWLKQFIPTALHAGIYAGTNTTDLRSYIQAAWDAAFALGVGCYDDGGTYKLTAPLEIPGTAFSFQGAGKKTVFVEHTASADGIRNTSGSRYFNVTLTDFVVKCAAGVQGGIGIHLEDISDSHFRNIDVQADDSSEGFTECWREETNTALGAYRNKFYDCRGRAFPGASSYGHRGINSNSSHWFGGALRADSGISAEMEADQSMHNGVTFEGTPSVGIKYIDDGAASQSNITAFCRFETPTTGILYDTGVRYCTDFGNFFTSGVTNKVTDTDGRCWSFNADSRFGSRSLLRRGHFEGRAVETSGEGVFIVRAAGTGVIGYEQRVTGDSDPRFRVTDARLSFGPGSSGVDCTLRRSATKVLQIETGRVVSAVRAFADSDTTPDVSDGHVFTCANTGATSITTFDGGTSGQEITVLLDANTTLVDGATLQLAGGANVTAAANKVVTMIFIGTVWYQTGVSAN